MGKHRHFYKKAGSDIWYCWGIKPGGERWTRSTRTNSFREAERRKREIERAILSASDLSAQESQTLNDAFLALYESLRRGNRKPATVKAAIQRGGHVLRVLGPRLDIAALGAGKEREPMLSGYVGVRLDEGAKRSTIAAEVGTLKQALVRAARSGLWRGVARDLMPVELRGAHVPRTTWHTPEQSTRMLKQIPPQWREHAETYLDTGVRRMELYTVEASSIDLAGNRVYVNGTKTKKSARWLPMTRRVRGILVRRAKLHPTGPLFREWTHVLPDLAAACVRAKVPTVTVTDLRRSFASALLNRGVTSTVLKELLGHTTTKQIDLVYGHIGDEAKQDAVGRLSGSRAVAGAAPRVRRNTRKDTPAAAEKPHSARRRSTSGTTAGPAWLRAFADFGAGVAER